MFFKNLWHFILGLFGIKSTMTSDTIINKNDLYNRKYEDIEQINFTSIFANKLSTLVCSESSVDVTGDNARSELLDDVSDRLWNSSKRIVSRALGTGGVIVVPYVKDGMILFDILSQNRFNINKKSGARITSATMMADTIKLDNKRFYRWTTYTLDNGNCYITNKVTNDEGHIVNLGEWGDIQDLMISGVDRLPFAFMKSPIDNRRMSDDYGVPITYGCDEILDEIYVCLRQIKDEYEMKRVRLQVDKRAFKRDDRGDLIIPDRLFMAGENTSNDAMFNIFDPSIRDSAFYNRLAQLFALLEKQIGTSKGIITDPESRGATATEIKASMYDTYSLVADIRKSLADFWDDFLYSCDVLSNCYSLSPMGEYAPLFDWSYSMIESSQETWAQLQSAQAIGVKSKAELRQWLTGESLDEAQEKINEIQENEPTLASLIGNA